MRFTVLGFDFRIRKNKDEGNGELRLSDLKELNDSTLSYVRSLSSGELDSRINSVCIASVNEVEKGKQVLEREGIVAIPGFVPSGVVALMEEAIFDIAKSTSKFINSKNAYFEDDFILFQKGGVKLSSYGNMANYKKTVVIVRMGQDEGMIDVFNVDYYYNNIGVELRPFFDNEDIKRLLGEELPSEYSGLRPRNLNFYMNKSIGKTRGFHVDSYSRQIKAFVYMTDVNVLDDGPYTYVKRSHVNTGFRRANQKLSIGLPKETETPIVSLENIVPVLAPKGSLVVSDQGGSHRGFPQAEGHERVVAVMNYR